MGGVVSELSQLLNKKFKNKYEQEQNVLGFLSRRMEDLHYDSTDIYVY